MSGRFDLGDYVDVDERIRRFYEKYPDGRIATLGIPQVTEIDGKRFIVAQAAAYRSPDDAQPCVGTAAEPFPGQTSYTKDSELMNAETSAWGRAIVAAGILAKAEKVASRGEVRNRRAENEGAGTAPAQPIPTPDSGASSPAPVNLNGEIGDNKILYALGEKVTPKQNQLQIDSLVRRHGYAVIKARLENALAEGVPS